MAIQVCSIFLFLIPYSSSWACMFLYITSNSFEISIFFLLFFFEFLNQFTLASENILNSFLPNPMYNFNFLFDFVFYGIVSDLFPWNNNCLITARINFQVTKFPVVSLATFHPTGKLERISELVFYIKDIMVYFLLAVSAVSPQLVGVHLATCQYTASMSGVHAKSISNTYMFSFYNLYQNLG